MALICIAAIAIGGYVAFHKSKDDPAPTPEPPVTPDDNGGFVQKMEKVPKTSFGTCPPYSHLDAKGESCEARKNCKRIDGSDFFMDPEGYCIADCSVLKYDTDDVNKVCVVPKCKPGEVWDSKVGCHTECSVD